MLLTPFSLEVSNVFLVLSSKARITQIKYNNKLIWILFQRGQCTRDVCNGALMTPRRAGTEPRPKDELLKLAKEFIDEYYQSIKRYFS